ncbi:MAG: M20/M25/M40 family metallo-hydrolase [Dehalococcoidia bacterium]|nr:M20/M25/M40 family metallo-hydrolase [Dehalococcoidia bacterium]
MSFAPLPRWLHWLTVVALSQLLVSCLPAPTSPPTDGAVSSPPPIATPQPGAAAPLIRDADAHDPAFSGQRAMRHVEQLATVIGPRPAGSAAYAEAVAYVTDQFRRAGYAVEQQAFAFSTFRLYQRQSDGGLTAIETIPLRNTGDGAVEAEVVYGGFGRPHELPATTRGRIALIARGDGVTFQDKATAAIAAGAVAVVIFNNEPGLFGGALQSQASVPVVGVSQADGQRLLAAIRAETVRLRVGQETVQSWNVIATHPGASASSGLIIIGAHLDTVPPAPGANDNASGSAVALELARAIAQQPLPAETRFILFGAEEDGLIGSRAYVRGMSTTDRDRLRDMINLDMVGVGDSFLLGGSAALVQQARQISAELGQRAGELPRGIAGASDHAAFIEAGLPAVFFHWANDPNYHQPTDRAEFVRPERLQFTGDLAWRLARALVDG